MKNWKWKLEILSTFCPQIQLMNEINLARLGTTGELKQTKFDNISETIRDMNTKENMQHDVTRFPKKTLQMCD